MNFRKAISIVIVAAMLVVNIPINLVQASTINVNNEELEQEIYEAEFETIKEEVFEEFNIEYTDEIELTLTDLNEETLNVETTFNSDDLEVSSELSMDMETEEMNFTTSFTDEEGNEINQEFDVVVEEADQDLFRATLTDLETGEQYHVDSEEIEASILPAIILGVIIRTSAKAAFKMYTRSQILKAVTSVTFKATQLQKKFNHAIDFGVKGNYSKANATKFETALRNHVSSSTHVYKTKHSGQSGHVIMHLKGNNAVFFKESGEFITGYKLASHQKDSFIRIGELIIKR
ncbi:SAR2788 family putative toxin [Bacillus sp. FJAT-27251]|uniref:SAR2788 family putative toxin n=1 Tax=Bacillus sp. FJAT-27251 TaxID=1684142 RepID=UPI0006A7A6A1|nr:SAR2788 family putative toxin [Bacillus sp. FJAT-27251]